MQEPSNASPCQRHGDLFGCAFIYGDNGGRRMCGEPRRLGSPYCAAHHALCHIRGGTRAEERRLREVEVLATAVGGRRSRDAGGPSRQFLRRLEGAVRDFL
jgi:hypothetical protein